MAKNIYQWSPNSPEERCIVSTRFVPGTWCCRTEMSVFLSLSFSWRTPREWKLPDGFCSAPTSPCGGCQACTRMRRNLWHPEVVFGTQSALEKCLLELNHISPVPNKISQGSFSPWELLDLFHLSDSEDLYLCLALTLLTWQDLNSRGVFPAHMYRAKKSPASHLHKT